MGNDRVRELGGRGKRKAKTWELEDGPSTFPSEGRIAVGDVDDGGGGEEGIRVAEEESRDPLEVFGSGILMMILSKLDARSGALARSVSREWLTVASTDNIWSPKEKRLVAVVQKMEALRSHKCVKTYGKGRRTYLPCQKSHIPSMSKVQGLPRWAAYSLSIKDGKRDRVTRADLCDHIWEFHFTEAAPEYWRSLDPYWIGAGAGRRSMRRYFHPDGSISADPDDQVWGGHESCYTIVTGLLMRDGKVREHYVRINRWPKLSVRRRQDWSWQLSNHLCCYTSVPDANRT